MSLPAYAAATRLPGPESLLSEDFMPTRSRRPKTEPLWRKHDAKAMKSGQRRTIYWVGKSIMGEDGSATGEKSNGASYHGEWHGDRKHGYGVQVFPNGEKYEGGWEKGLRNGEGTLWVPTGKAQKLRKLYVGGWKDDKRHGRGTCFFKNGEFFQGHWDNGKMHGQGTLRYECGDLYVGEWHDGLRSGKGTLNKANGDCYEGYWLADKREGSGSYFYAASGKVFVGEWADDRPKAGVYTQAMANPEQSAAVPVTSELPPVRLALPEEVLEGALAAVRNARKSARAQHTPISKLFAEDELDALRSAFAQVAQADGRARVAELQGLCMQLGAEVSPQRFQRLLAEAGYKVEAAEAAVGVEVTLAFEGFLRLVAVLLDEEASAAAEAGPPRDQSTDFWAEDVGGSEFEMHDPDLEDRD